MKKILYIFSGMALGCLMLSCEDINEGGNMDREPIAVQMKASILPFDNASPENWKGGEELGMFMFPSGGDISSSACVRLKTDAEGVMQAVEPGKMPEYPSDASKVNFICFSPYNEAAASGKTLALNVSTDEKALQRDYLYSDNARNKYPSLTPVKVQMRHVLSLVRFDITAAEEITADVLKGLNPQIDGVPAEGTFSLAEGKMASTGNPASIVMSTDGQMSSAECMMLPATSSVTVKCNVEGMVLRKKLGNMSFESGKLYIFDLHVTTPGFDISLREIQDWNVETFN